MAVLCHGLEKNGMVRAWHGCSMASVNQTWPHCVNQMGKTHSKPLMAWHGRATAWAQHAMCESASTLFSFLQLINQKVLSQLQVFQSLDQENKVSGPSLCCLFNFSLYCTTGVVSHITNNVCHGDVTRHNGLHQPNSPS